MFGVYRSGSQKTTWLAVKVERKILVGKVCVCTEGWRQISGKKRRVAQEVRQRAKDGGVVCDLPTVRINVLLMFGVYRNGCLGATWLAVEFVRKILDGEVCICTAYTGEGRLQVKKDALLRR